MESVITIWMSKLVPSILWILLYFALLPLDFHFLAIFLGDDTPWISIFKQKFLSGCLKVLKIRSPGCSISST